MKIGHHTVKVETKEKYVWNCSVMVHGNVTQNDFTVRASTSIQALQKAWRKVAKNKDKYDIDEWGPGQLAIDVEPVE